MRHDNPAYPLQVRIVLASKALRGFAAATDHFHRLMFLRCLQPDKSLLTLAATFVESLQ